VPTYLSKAMATFVFEAFPLPVNSFFTVVGDNSL